MAYYADKKKSRYELQLKTAEKDVRSGRILCFYLLFGDDDSGIQNFLSGLISASLGDNVSDFNINYFDGSKDEPDDIFDLAGTVPLMSQKRVVVVDDYFFVGKRSADEEGTSKTSDLNLERIEKLRTRSAGIPDSTVMVFRQQTLPSGKEIKNTVCALFESLGCVLEINRPENEDLYDLIISLTAREGKTISRRTAQYLAAKIDNNYSMVESEVKKICSASGEKTVTEAVIDSVSSRSKQLTVNDLTKQIYDIGLSRKNMALSLRILKTLLDQKTQPEMILGAIAGKYIELYKVKLCALSGSSTDRLKRLPEFSKRTFVIDKAERIGRAYSRRSLSRIIDALAKADTDLKNSRDNAQIIFEQLLFTIFAEMEKRND